MIVVILISIGSLCGVYLLRTDRNELRVERTQLTESLITTKAWLVRTETKLQDTLVTLTTTSNTLVKTIAELDATNKVLIATIEEREKLKVDLADTQKKLQDANTELASTKDALKKAEETIVSQTAEIAKIDAYKKQIADLTAENKVFGDKLELALVEIKRLELENEDLRKTPVNCRGRVAGVENRWNFVVLDIGQDQKVRKNSQFLVYRDKTFICKAQIISVNENTAVAEVLPEFRRGDPRIGDVAIH